LHASKMPTLFAAAAFAVVALGASPATAAAADFPPGPYVAPSAADLPPGPNAAAYPPGPSAADLPPGLA